MANPRVFEFAKDIGMTPLALMDKLREWQLPVKSHMAELSPELLEQIKIKLSGKDQSGSSQESKPKKAVARKTAVKKVVAKPEVAPEAVSASAAAPGVLNKSTIVRRKTKDGDEVKLAPIEPGKARIVRKVEVTLSQPQEEIVETPKIEIARPIRRATAPSEDLHKAQEQAQAAAPTPAVPAAPSAPVSVVSEMPVAGAVEEIKSSEPKVGRKKEVVVGTSGVSSTLAPMTAAPRRNIIGRMDLSRVTPASQSRTGSGGYQGSGGNSNTQGGFNAGPGGARPPGAGGFQRGPTSGVAGRNVRAGFVASTPMPSEFDIAALEEERKRDLEKRAKKGLGGSGGREEETVVFNPVEFRKKEMVFQPRKKTTTMSKLAQKTAITQPKATKRVVKVYGTMKLSALADEIGVKAPQLTKVLMANGVSATMNTSLDFDTISLIVPEFGWEAQNIQRTDTELVNQFAYGDMTAVSVVRPPVVAVMGHVDHGKTSLLDAIRKADVASGEAGGITQHIGAYSVELEDHSRITFLDTPGHEAFTAMRARGANVTDIAIIVVAADDGVMPQTAEAINHAKAAGVPLIIAVNKIDKPGAQVEKIKQQLTEYEVVPEEWGGTTIFCEVSAIKKIGIKELLERIQLVAEVQELRANPLRSGTGTVIEAKVEKGKGSVATILVKDGTVKIGQIIVAGTSKGRVRSLMNDKGERVKEALPGYPVEVQGLEATPLAGDRFDIVKDDRGAEELIASRKESLAASQHSGAKLTLEQIFAKATAGDVKELPIVLKADVQGSVEAISGMLKKLESPLVKTRVIHAAVGPISETDVLLAQTAKGLVIGFNVRPDTGAQAKAKQLEIEIRTYSIVYEMIDDMKKALSGLLTPDIVEKVLGRAEVRNTFTVPKIGTIAGCFVIDGKVVRSAQARLLRDGKIIYEGKISSLKRFKDDAKEVATGFECGIGIENFNDVKNGDAIEIFIKEEVAKELELNG